MIPVTYINHSLFWFVKAAPFKSGNPKWEQALRASEQIGPGHGWITLKGVHN